mgnify:FL=1
MSESTIKNPITIVLALEASHCNPNGDPDNDNAPRQFENGIGYMSSECIKYKIRSFIRDKIFFGLLDEERHHFYCSPDTFSIESSVKECMDAVSKELANETKKLTAREIDIKKYAALCDYFYDARMFGLVNTSEAKSGILGKIKGACQLSMPISYDPINIIPMTITRCCVSSDKERKGTDGVENGKDRMMGHRSMVEYGLYHMSIQINSMMAQRNGVTMDDVNLLIDALLHMCDADMSSCRNLTMRKLIVVEHTKPMGDTYRDTIEEALTATLKEKDNNPTAYADYDVAFHRELLPEQVKVTEYSIAHPEGVTL